MKKIQEFLNSLIQLPSQAKKKSERGFLDYYFQYPLVKWCAVLCLGMAITFITTFSFQSIPKTLQLGSIATQDFKADRSYEIVDEDATKKLRDEARAAVIPLYVFDESLKFSKVEKVHSAFRETRAKAYDMAFFHAKEKKLDKKSFVLTENDKEVLSELFTKHFGIKPNAEQWTMLVKERFSSRVETMLVQQLEEAMDAPLVSDKASLESNKDTGIIVRKKQGIGSSAVVLGETKVNNVLKISSVDEVKAKLQKKSLPAQGLYTRHSIPKIIDLAASLVEANCIFARQETEELKEKAAQNVKNVIIKISPGEIIIRHGARFEPWHHKVLKGIQKERGKGTYPYEFFGTLLLVMLVLVVPFYVGEKFLTRFHPNTSDYLLMASVALICLFVLRISLILSPAITQALMFSLPEKALIYAIPFSAAVMLIRMFLSIESALIFAIPMTVFSGLFVETGVNTVAFVLISNFAAIIMMKHIDRRTMIIRAGAAVGLFSALTMLGLKFISISSVEESSTASDIFWFMTFAFFGGITSSIVTMIFLPILESVSGYVTDIKLLELANLNHPLLRELIVQAPGTYHHSHLVGMLGEAAAEKIGANSLLVRVSAYYHDIGKMKKPSYYIENTKGESKHDKLSPHMSALIVASHVKDGLEMAKNAKIPKSIMDMIPQHHGTRMISFFYKKAKELADPNLQKVNREDFCYPGPKPQTREAAIMMLSDVVEASVRSLKEKSATRIQQIVRRSITDVYTERQLDESELTLKDLNDIGKAFVHILLGIYHER
ncbi:MAG: hypothetical protein COX62_02405, partial [Deltaproteobacteria bacterium CG_4_10_14_0_2_um_filter_43_8]